MFEQGISRTTRTALAVLGKSTLVKQFYLAGGTACALHLGHRLSFDLDFFTPTSFNAKVLSRKIAALGSFIEDQVLPDTLLGTFLDTKVSFFQYRYPQIRKVHPFEGIAIADLADIAAMKIDAISSRGIKRDFIDLFFIAKHYTVDEILTFYDQKYQRLEINRFHIIKSLAYFGDADPSEMPKMIVKISWEEVKLFFEKEAIRLGKKYL